jgi:hypothetical protein
MSMKKLVWSETDVVGPGKTFSGKLAEPPSNEGQRCGIRARAAPPGDAALLSPIRRSIAYRSAGG